MARKGSKKVRTGCITCKVRKIKCDETKPFCRRCTSTGRICDGYSPWGQATRATHLTVIYKRSGTAEEQRGLQYFCEVAAPCLLGPKSPYFWTHLVMQLSESEPVVKHSLLAISSLYENREVQRTSPAPPNLALRHYNAAIRELKTTQSDVLALNGYMALYQRYRHPGTLRQPVGSGAPRFHIPTDQNLASALEQ
ncbi:C6 zinc finger domain protein [Fusarium sp. NRRL 25303]|nr:C6 zinc finger domain protein [Fusarium sp. NRRL 25303]